MWLWIDVWQPGGRVSYLHNITQPTSPSPFRNYLKKNNNTKININIKSILHFCVVFQQLNPINNVVFSFNFNNPSSSGQMILHSQSFQLLEYQWREGRFDTLGKLVSAHPGGGQHPPGGWVPPGGCCLLPSPHVGRDQLPLSHKRTATASPLLLMTEATSMLPITKGFGLWNIPLNLNSRECLRKGENVYQPQRQSYMDEVRTTLDVQ